MVTVIAHCKDCGRELSRSNAEISADAKDQVDYLVRKAAIKSKACPDHCMPGEVCTITIEVLDENNTSTQVVNAEIIRKQ